ncbi:outer membrane protein assembly factor BamE [Sedimentitalea arenosa]|jgi:outer membrane protein assembly factor BamE (lipoprotein component of BamABCDE complex)|uniref:Outer membrane protein assembly factor BamE n=1 Tax=Sedimentitalea arenosa TaxID=2798803 RepID=A0A8J7LST6_9RHOB|nr:outer membrane protein assembly factor BamE [Arenibacterium arenosum]MBJ6373198.1 outer membrane protein assembly factor BamE [Arenibacterium arenosum]
MGGTAAQVKRMARVVVVAGLVATVAGCTAIYRDHGYVPTEEDLAEVTVGVDTRDTVAETIGAPTASGVLNDGGYYYVSSRMRHYGATQPRVVERQLVAISFSQRGVVENIERYSLQDGRVIALNRRVTETSVNNTSFLRQLLGNLGNFSPTDALPE